jgi:uncharacterized membrane protein YphA (DoxX/SURF4 family)
MSRPTPLPPSLKGGGKRSSRFTPAWWLTLALRLGIAAVFLWAARDKLVHPDQFADIVHDYGLLPVPLVNVFAVCLPWAEVAVAVCLVLGIWVESAALVATGMTMMFIGALAAALAQGHGDLACGCTSTSPEARHDAWGLLVRDAGLLFVCAWLFWRTWRAGKVSRETNVSRETLQEDERESGD